jgi:hypothetical protein
VSEVKYICLAGSIREYYDWLHKHQIKHGESLYASTPTLLKNLPNEAGISFHQVGTFEERKDALQILEAVREGHPQAVIYTDR